MLCHDLFMATCRVWVELLVNFVDPCKQKNDIGNKMLSRNEYPSLVAKEEDGINHAPVRGNKLLGRVGQTITTADLFFIEYRY